MFSLNTGQQTRAIAKRCRFHPGSIQQTCVEITKRCVFSSDQMFAPAHSTPVTGQYHRQISWNMFVTVPNAGTEQDEAVVEQVAVALPNALQPILEVG